MEPLISRVSISRPSAPETTAVLSPIVSAAETRKMMVVEAMAPK